MTYNFIPETANTWPKLDKTSIKQLYLVCTFIIMMSVLIQPIWYTNYMNRYSTIESTKSLLLVQQQVEWVLWPHAEDNTGIKCLLNVQYDFYVYVHMECLLYISPGSIYKSFKICNVMTIRYHNSKHTSGCAIRLHVPVMIIN